MPLHRSILGQCPDCCACPAPEVYFFPIITVNCVSLAGTADICGWSGYRPDGNTQDDDDPAAPWQGRKWADKTLAGDLSTADGSCTSCEIPEPVSGSNRGQMVFSGVNTVACEGDTFTGSVAVWTGSNSPGPGCSNNFIGNFPKDDIDADVGGIIVSACNPVVRSNAQFLETHELTVRTLTGCGCNTDASSPYAWEGTGVATATLGDEQTFAGALEAVTPPITPGDSCCAYITSQSLTSPESTDSISKTGQAVTLEIAVEGAPSTTYTIRLRFSNENMSDPLEEIDDTLEEIEVTIDSEGLAELEYIIEEPAVGYRRCFVRAESDSYQFRFPTHRVRNGACYRLSWFERIYDPEVGLSLVSIPVLLGGSGYTTAPEVTIDPPALSEDDGGVQAEAVAVVDTEPTSPTFGQVTAINITVAGAGYTGDSLVWWGAFVGVSIAAPGGGGVTAAAGCVELSGDTLRTWHWDGTVPEDYDPADATTWPRSPAFDVALEEGEVWRLACIVAACEGCDP